MDGIVHSMPRSSFSKKLARVQESAEYFEDLRRLIADVTSDDEGLTIEHQLHLLAWLQGVVEANVKAAESGGRKSSAKGAGEDRANDDGEKPNKHATRSPSFAELAERFISDNPDGVRTVEVAKAVKQTVASAHGTLALLLRQKRVERHGSRMSTLWTKPGATPAARVETIAAAILKVVASATAPVDAAFLQSEAIRVLKAATRTKRTLRPDSVRSEIYKLVNKGLLKTSGANENGPFYVAVENNAKGEAARRLKLVP